MNKAKWLVLAVVAVIVVGGSVLAVRAARSDNGLAEVQQLREQLRGEDAKKMEPEQRRELWNQYQEKVKQLPYDQKKKLNDESDWTKRGKDTMDQYFALQSPEEQQAFLDKKIDEWEDRRKQWEAQRAAGGGPGSGGPRGNRGGGGQAPAAADANAGGGGAAPTTGQQPGRPSAEDRDKMRRERLDMSTPIERAQRAEFFRAMAERRKERGMTGGGGPGGGR